jgi:integrase
VPLKVIQRPDRPGGRPQITGTVFLPNGERIAVRQAASTTNLQLAREEAATIEANLLRSAWHGERRGARLYTEALEEFLKADRRGAGDVARHIRILGVIGDAKLSAVNQEMVSRVRAAILKPDASPATVLRGVISPIRAVMNFANAQGWCDSPRFVVPKQPQGRTAFLYPHQFEALIAASAPHLEPLLLTLADTGARMSEAIEALWDDVDLGAARINYVRTKNGKPRLNVPLSPRTVAALARLPHREAEIFRTQRGEAYESKGRQEGGQIKHGWQAALRRAGLAGAGFTPHDLRHTWATWHYALHRDLLRLKVEGGWSSIELVERYAHLMPGDLKGEIEALWRRLPAARAGEGARAEAQWFQRLERRA